MKAKPVTSRIIRFDDKIVTVKMMDDSWIINRCVSEAPFKPKPGVVWGHENRCGRLLIPGDEYEQTMRYFRDTYGNAAVVAWDGESFERNRKRSPASSTSTTRALYSRSCGRDFGSSTTFRFPQGCFGQGCRAAVVEGSAGIRGRIPWSFLHRVFVASPIVS